MDPKRSEKRWAELMDNIPPAQHSPDEERVERMARWLFERVMRDRRLDYRWDDVDADIRPAWLGDARAALAAADEDDHGR